MLYYLFQYLEKFDFPGSRYVRLRFIPFIDGNHFIIVDLSYLR